MNQRAQVLISHQKQSSQAQVLPLQNVAIPNKQGGSQGIVKIEQIHSRYGAGGGGGYQQADFKSKHSLMQASPKMHLHEEDCIDDNDYDDQMVSGDESGQRDRRQANWTVKRSPRPLLSISEMNNAFNQNQKFKPVIQQQLHNEEFKAQEFIRTKRQQFDNEDEDQINLKSTLQEDEIQDDEDDEFDYDEENIVGDEHQYYQEDQEHMMTEQDFDGQDYQPEPEEDEDVPHEMAEASSGRSSDGVQYQSMPYADKYIDQQQSDNNMQMMDGKFIKLNPISVTYSGINSGNPSNQHQSYSSFISASTANQPVILEKQMKNHQATKNGSKKDQETLEDEVNVASSPHSTGVHFRKNFPRVYNKRLIFLQGFEQLSQPTIEHQRSSTCGNYFKEIQDDIYAPGQNSQNIISQNNNQKAVGGKRTTSQLFSQDQQQLSFLQSAQFKAAQYQQSMSTSTQNYVIQPNNISGKHQEQKSPIQTPQEDQETQLLKLEYLKLKQQLCQLQIQSQPEISQRRKTAHMHSQQQTTFANEGDRKRNKIEPEIAQNQIQSYDNASKQQRKALRPASSQNMNEFLKTSTGKNQGQRRDKNVDRLSHSSKSSEESMKHNRNRGVLTNVGSSNQNQRKRDISKGSKIKVYNHHQQQSKSSKLTKRKHYLKCSQGTHSVQSSSFEDFHQAAKNPQKNNQQYSDSDEGTEKQLIVSNLKSSASRRNKNYIMRKKQTQQRNQSLGNENNTEKEFFSQSESSPSKGQSMGSEGVEELYQEGDDEYESSGKQKKRAAAKQKQSKHQASTSIGEKFHTANIVKSRKDRKQLKININMNSVTGAPQSQYSQGELSSHRQNLNEELLQRQIFQQQQFLLAALAQQQSYALQPTQQQQILLQQQLAFQKQQQLLLSQPLLTQSSPFPHPSLVGLTPSTILSMPHSTNPSLNGNHQQSNFTEMTSSYHHQQQQQQQYPPQYRPLHKDHSAGNLDPQNRATSLVSPQRSEQLYPQSRYTDFGRNAQSPKPMPIQISQLIENNQNRSVQQQQKRQVFEGERNMSKDYNNQAMHQSRNRNIQANYSSPVKPSFPQAKSQNFDQQRQNNENIEEYLQRQKQFQIDQLTQKSVDEVLHTQSQDPYSNFCASTHQQSVQNKEKRYLIDTKTTGQFGAQQSSNVLQKTQSPPFKMSAKDPSMFIQDRNIQKEKLYGDGRSRSSSASELAIDECITIKNAHKTIQKSPNAVSIEWPTQKDNFKNDKSIFTNKNSTISEPLVSPRQQEQQKQQQININLSPDIETDSANPHDQDKKEPQALWIGFSDDNQLKDPFKDKPVLKNRKEPADLAANRSKSAKGGPSGFNLARGSKRVTQKPAEAVVVETVKFNIKEVNQDQLRSPVHIKQNSSKQQKDSIIRTPAEPSPMKKAVVILQNEIKKESAKAASQQKRPATAKVTKDPASKQELILTAKERIPFKVAVQQKEQSQQNNLKAVQIDLNKIIQKPPKVSISKNVINEEEEEIIDPSHNQNLVIEILDKRNAKNTQKAEPSLAEMFKAKKGAVLEKITHNRNSNLNQDQDNTQEQVQPKKEKTKEELFELRKQMMKTRVTKPQQQQDLNQAQNKQPQSDKDQNQQHGGKPKLDLMERLALGKKTQVDQKEMKRLTKQNYHNLPEIKKKREEEQKRQENQARKAATQEYLKQLDETRKKKAAASQKKRVQGSTSGIQDKINNQ